VTEAVRERLDRVRSSNDDGAAQRAERIRRIGKDAAPRWVEPYRSADHADILYDERGLPR
jgi:antitoxin VapB